MADDTFKGMCVRLFVFAFVFFVIPGSVLLGVGINGLHKKTCAIVTGASNQTEAKFVEKKETFRQCYYTGLKNVNIRLRR